ncbi:RHS repeat protein [Sphingobacterium phlebotomi]|uniref:RHS repeat protein n=1 Tax=Sphingobacterium phlebotomi TaxID=2605433 RepID=A0A5D4H6I5_9SPHI|nr:DUF5977 domain-containing protein [Sphingobacterium phlebotomi]TYR36318.1 RHS repeat protein [Sphingobacterium phlebotomi]
MNLLKRYSVHNELKFLRGIFLFFLFAGICTVKAQRISDMSDLFASPQTTAIFKLIEAPVTYYTGQPNISIPIYTIEEKGISIPVTISFNTSGIYVTEESTAIGIGARLDWGGAIVRSANGRPDEHGFFSEPYMINELKQEIPKNYNAFQTPSAVCYPYCNMSSSILEFVRRAEIYDVVKSYNDPYKTGNSGTITDLRPDNFFYNFSNKSGLFRFNQSNRKFLTFPLDDINIKHSIGSSFRIQKFDITTSDGVMYTFGDGAVEFTSEFANPFDQAWFIRRVSNANGSSVEFEYLSNHYIRAKELKEEYWVPYPNGGYSSSTGGEGYITEEMLIQQITFNSGRLEFKYIRDRQDFSLTAPNFANAGMPAPRLDEILLFNKENELVKSFKFHQSYFVANQSNDPVLDKRLKLDSLSIKDISSKAIERYKFLYYQDGSLPTKQTKGRDHWGYYNGADDNTSLIPSSSKPLAEGFRPLNYWGVYNDRAINEQKSKCFTIKSIVFPTGARREYDFENHDVRWYEEYNEMKELSNEGYDLHREQLIVGGSTLSQCSPIPDYISTNGAERIIYSNEFDVLDFNDLPIGDPSVHIQTNYIHSEITNSELNMWDYRIIIGLQKKTENTFNNHVVLASVDQSNFTKDTELRAKLPFLVDGTYRIYVRLLAPPPFVMDQWDRQYDHNTIIRLAYRRKNYGNIRVGGLRIKEITDYEGDSTYSTNFEYVVSDNYSSGNLVNAPQYKEYISTKQQNSVSGGSPIPYHGYRICSEPVIPLAKTQGSNVGYTNVIKSRVSGEEVLKEEYSFSFKKSLNSGYYKEYYQEIEPRIWQNGKLNTMTMFKDNIPIYKEVYDYYGTEKETDKGFVEEINTNLLGNLAGYGYQTNTSDITIGRRAFNDYTVLYHVDNYSRIISPYESSIVVSPPIKIPYFKIYTGFDKIKSKRTINYSPSGTTEQLTTYYYDNLDHLQPTRIEVISSEGSKNITQISYPNDYINISGFIGDMKEKHLIAYPIEQVNYKEVGTARTILSGKLTTYKTGGKGLLDEIFLIETANPIALSTFKFSNRSVNQLPPIGIMTSFSPDERYHSRYTYNSYDIKGNPLQVTEVDHPPTSYLWSYNGQYLLAEIRNANQSDIAYSGFEDEGKGNWTYSGSTIRDATAPTGRLVYSLQGGSMVKAGLAPSRKYILTYWAKGASAANISGGIAMKMNTKGGWIQYRREVTAVSSVTLSGNVLIDDVRLYPLEASMFTATYIPLVGMTSKSDPRGITEYYEYDSFGRLSTVKDFEGNILKTYCYNYAGQQVDCYTDPIVYKNVPKSQIFQKNNCTAGLIGSNVTYTVPAEVYTSIISQADADQQALDDIDANGQSYANQHGSCVSPVTALTLHNKTGQQLSNASISLWQGTVLVGTYSFPQTVGGSQIYFNIPAGTYRIDTNISTANPTQYTFRLPTLGLTKIGNSSFGQIQLVANGILPVELEFNFH